MLLKNEITMMKLTRYVLYDIMRNRIVLLYAAFLFLITIGLFQLEDNPSKAILSLLTVVLTVLPLVSLIFTTIHYYNSYEFIELMLAQPLSRTRVLLSEFGGLSLSLLGAFWVGVGLPVLFYAPDQTSFALLLTGSLLTLIFISMAFFTSIHSRDKARGIGLALLLWFYFTLIYDGLLLIILFALSDYPMEKATLLLSALNPVDLARIVIMLKMDISALMGYTGAVYKDFFGSSYGTMFTIGVLCVWAIVPFLISHRRFLKKDM
jgi:Cu-processing system permease protein